MTENATLAELTKWPTKVEDVNADLVLRILGRDTQIKWLLKWKELEAGERDKHSMLLECVVSSVGLMACIRALKEVDPFKADTFVKDYWEMCEAGDSFGELLWEFTEEAGLDPGLVKLPEPATTAD
jgi:hypothetical protein